MQYDAAVVANEFAAFLEALGTGRTYKQALVARIKDLFSFFTSEGLEADAIEDREAIQKYETSRGIHMTRHAEQHVTRIRRYLLQRNMIGGKQETAPSGEVALPEVMARFLLSLANAGYRDQTLRRYTYALADLTRFAGELDISTVSGLTPKVMQDYASLVVSQAKVKRTPAVMAQLVGSVKQFTRYSLEEGYLLRDPMIRIRLPRQGRVISRNFLSKEELEAFFSAIDTTTLSGFTDRVLFELMYGAGLRISEALGLTLSDLDFTEGLVRVKDGKGGKDRAIPLPEVTRSYLQQYLEHVRPELLARYKVSSQLLFFNSKGKTLSEVWVNHWLRFYAARAGITKHLTSHCLRYSYATHMLEAGIDMRQLAELMGHESLDTTAGYTKVLVKDLKAELAAYHPHGGEDFRRVTFKGICK